MAEAINLYLAASAAIAASGNSGDLAVYGADSLDFHMNITAVAGTSPTLQVLIETKALDGLYYTVYDTGALSAIAATSKSIGPFLELAKSFGDVIRVRWVIGGSATPSVTASISLTGRKTARTNAS